MYVNQYSDCQAERKIKMNAQQTDDPRPKFASDTPTLRLINAALIGRLTLS